MHIKSHLTAVDLVGLDRPLVIAHRGYSQLAPENTLPAFRLALKAGADLVELDFHQTKDGQLIAIHDAELDRTTNARNQSAKKHIKIKTKRSAEILHLDAGSWFDAKFAHTRVPLLHEALKLIQRRAVSLLERKSGDPAACLKIMRQRNLERTVVQSFDWAFLRQIRELEPRLTVAALGPPFVLPNGKRARRVFRRLTARWIGFAQKTGAKVIVWNKRISARSVRLAHARGMRIWVYTVNNAKVARRLLNCGVDGLITNDPALVWNSIEEHLKNLS